MIIDDIIKLLEYDSESSILDYKRDQYPIGKDLKRNELLKDISAFANHYSNNDKFIIIGVIEKNGQAFEFVNIEQLTDEAKYQELIKSNVEPEIIFEYKPFTYKGYKLAYFRIFNNKDRPYLMKKDVKNPVNGEIDFREGDGYIRIGTSTKKLTRSDFDKIYKSKFQKKDRKTDLIINAYCKEYSDDEISPELGIKYLDIEIVNISNRSIDIDVELKVYKGEGYVLIPEPDLRNELNKKLGIRNGYSPITVISNIRMHYEEHDDYIIITKNLKRNKTDLSLKQNSKETDVFEKYLCVIKQDDNEYVIQSELYIRSDDFIGGMLTKTVEFKI